MAASRAAMTDKKNDPSKQRAIAPGGATRCLRAILGPAQDRKDEAFREAGVLGRGGKGCQTVKIFLTHPVELVWKDVSVGWFGVGAPLKSFALLP